LANHLARPSGLGPDAGSHRDSVAQGRQFDAGEPWVYVARIMVCLATLSGDVAVAAARKAIELNPNFAYGYSFLGVALAAAGDGAAAIAAVDHAVRLSPRDLLRDEFDLFYAFAYFQKGDYAKAAKFAASAASLRPGHAYPYRILAASSSLAGDQKRASGAVTDILALTPGFNLTAAAAQCVYAHDAVGYGSLTASVRPACPNEGVRPPKVELQSKWLTACCDSHQSAERSGHHA
jgi:adenylate cyclase